MTEPRSWAGTQRVSLWKESLEGLGRPGVDPHGLAHDWGQSARTRAHTHTHTCARARALMGSKDLHSDMWSIGVTLFLFGFRFLQCRWWCFGS